MNGGEDPRLRRALRRARSALDIIERTAAAPEPNFEILEVWIEGGQSEIAAALSRMPSAEYIRRCEELARYYGEKAAAAKARATAVEQPPSPLERWSDAWERNP